MGIILGYICFLSLLLMLAKYIARKSGNKKVNHFFQKLHKPVSCIFMTACLVHLIIVIPVLKTRNVWVNISGFLAAGIAVLLVVLCHTIKNGKEKMHWHRLLSIVLFVAALLHVVTYFADFEQYKAKISSITIEDIDLYEIEDGHYIGEYNAGYIYAKVQVTVENGTITQIELLEHNNERGKRAEIIVDHIVAEQHLDVDEITGATNSSLVIKKACENALKQPLVESTP